MVTTIGAIGGILGAPGMHLALIAMGCGVEKEFPWYFHPLRFEVSGSMAAGAIVGNLLITAVAAILCVTLAALFKTTGAVQSVFNTEDAYGLLRFPSAPLFVFIVLYQGLALAGMVLTAHPPTLGLFLLGASTTVICFALPCYMLVLVKKNVPTEAFYEPVPDREDSTVATFLLGPGEWVSRRPSYHFALRFTCALRSFTQKEVCGSVLRRGVWFRGYLKRTSKKKIL